MMKIPIVVSESCPADKILLVGPSSVPHITAETKQDSVVWTVRYTHKVLAVIGIGPDQPQKP